MKKLQETAKKLNDIIMHYARQINSGAIINICPVDISSFKMLLKDLISRVKIYSPYLSASLDDISKYLFVNHYGRVTFNAFRFGALKSTVHYLQSKDFICNYAKYIITPWNDINEAVEKLLIDSNNVEGRLDYNQVGVICREIYILLAQKVFNPELYKTDDKAIGTADAKGMFVAYLDYTLDDKKLKEYAKSAVALAEPVTHAKSENKVKMDTLVIALISLVGIINKIENE